MILQRNIGVDVRETAPDSVGCSGHHDGADINCDSNRGSRRHLNAVTDCHLCQPDHAGDHQVPTNDDEDDPDDQLAVALDPGNLGICLG
jgi:hypothetical protein